MRESNRDKVLAAAARLVEREGVRSVTYESVAAESGLTKGGLLYHFASRDDLLLAIHHYIAAEWEESLEAAAGVKAEDATRQQKLAAYTRIAIEGTTRAKLLFMLEGSTDPASAAPWNEVLARWTISAEETIDDPEALAMFVARLATDGLWLFEAMGSEIDPGLHTRVAAYLASVSGTPELAIE
ncbi:MAG TPA: TetR/AcrR family transcriptional regulator [Pseudolysinimonas sp.]|nr:TetR/AcrR family transcriptional regulator [Pseudolysinimonas sp.]